MRTYFRSEEEKREIVNVTGMPCMTNPSDHVPMGAVFCWNDESNAIDDFFLKVKPNKSSFGSPSNQEEESAESVREDAMSLLMACPISDEERDEFESTLLLFANEDSNGSVVLSQKKGKPSQIEIDYYQHQRQRKEVIHV
jgi:hypothetical protein